MTYPSASPARGNTEMLTAALAFCDAGCSVVPVAADGTKRPLGAWKAAQTTAATRAEVMRTFAHGHPGLGVVTGAVSGNLLMVELEGRAVAEGMVHDLREMAFASGLGALWRRVTSGYLERTPSGGAHLLVRVPLPVGGNLKLARRPGPPDPTTGKPTVEVLAETRGEGGFVVVAPSHGPVHPTGRPWQHVAGSPATIPLLTAEDTDALLRLFRTLDRMPRATPAIPPRARLTPAGPRPGDDFNARASWDDLLVPHGWQHVFTRGQTRFWRRPGKSDGISATTGYGAGDWLYVFSSSTVLPTERTLTKFAAYAHLEHGGDFRAAARDLRARGFRMTYPSGVSTATAIRGSECD